MNKAVKNTESLLRDWRHVIVAIAFLFAINIGVNWISASADLSELAAEAQASGNTIEDQPSSFGEAISRTIGSLYGIVDLVNIVALVAVAGLVGFYAMKLFWPNSLARFGASFDDGWYQMKETERSRWKLVVWLVIIFGVLAGRSQAASVHDPIDVDGLSLPISEKARDMIIYYEVGGRKSYERSYERPIVPAWRTTVSGVTTGFGVDVGHMTKSQIHSAMTGIVPASQIRLLQSVSGMKGRNAYYNGLPKVRNSVRITWDQATKIFERNTLPRFTKLTASAFRIDKDRLHPSENGALTSLVFNRGSSMSSKSSRKEMRSIRYDIGRGYAGFVPHHIRSMKRLWSRTKLRGLHLRRDSEARLFSEGSKLRMAR